jgi:hypothetical protein
VRTRIFQVWMLLPILTLCAVLSAATTPTGPKETEKTPVYNVDGVSTGMTKDEVREIWGPLRQSDASGKEIRYLERPGSEPKVFPFRSMVTLKESRVVEVRGLRLKFGDRLIVAPEHSLAEVEVTLGQPAEPAGYSCGRPGPLREVTRSEGEVVFEATGWNLDQFELPEGKTLQEALEEHPEYDQIQAISIHDRSFYYRHSRVRK